MYYYDYYHEQEIKKSILNIHEGMKKNFFTSMNILVEILETEKKDQ